MNIKELVILASLSCLVWLYFFDNSECDHFSDTGETATTYAEYTSQLTDNEKENKRKLMKDHGATDEWIKWIWEHYRNDIYARQPPQWPGQRQEGESFIPINQMNHRPKWHCQNGKLCIGKEISPNTWTYYRCYKERPKDSIYGKNHVHCPSPPGESNAWNTVWMVLGMVAFMWFLIFFVFTPKNKARLSNLGNRVRGHRLFEKELPWKTRLTGRV